MRKTSLSPICSAASGPAGPIRLLRRNSQISARGALAGGVHTLEAQLCALKLRIVVEKLELEAALLAPMDEVGHRLRFDREAENAALGEIIGGDGRT